MTTDRLHSPSRTYANKYGKVYRMGGRLMVPALGSTRRVQALRAIGYTLPQLADATGFSEIFLRQLSYGRFTKIDKRRAERIKDVYRTLCVQPQHKAREAKIARAYAKKKKFYPPMAWDDIDNPRERGSLRAKNRHNAGRVA